MPDDSKPPDPIPEMNDLARKAVAEYGSLADAVKRLASDNHALKDDLKAARAKQPPDGSRVLQGDDIKLHDEYRSLGPPADLRKTLDEHKALTQWVDDYRRDEVLRGVAEKAGANFAVLKTIAPPGTAFEARTVKVDGKDAEVVHVKDGDKAEPVRDYFARTRPEFMAALFPAPAEPAGKPSYGTPSRYDNYRAEPNEAPAAPPPPRRSLAKL
jgi:hypothetical protein